MFATLKRLKRLSILKACHQDIKNKKYSWILHSGIYFVENACACVEGLHSLLWRVLPKSWLKLLKHWRLRSMRPFHYPTLGSLISPDLKLLSQKLQLFEALRICTGSPCSHFLSARYKGRHVWLFPLSLSWCFFSAYTVYNSTLSFTFKLHRRLEVCSPSLGTLNIKKKTFLQGDPGSGWVGWRWCVLVSWHLLLFV